MTDKQEVRESNRGVDNYAMFPREAAPDVINGAKGSKFSSLTKGDGKSE